MDEKTRQALHKKIAQRFPEVAAQKAQIRRQPASAGQEEPNFLLVYKTKITTSQGKVIPRIIRVVASPRGKIIKLTTSR